MSEVSTVDDGALEERSGSSLDVALDPEPAPRQPAPVDVASVASMERRPIVPPQWSGREAISRSVAYYGALASYRAKYHGLRLVPYVLLAVVWSPVGLAKVVARQVSWWWSADGAFALSQSAATQDDAHVFTQQHRLTLARRSYRGWLLLAELVAALIAVTVLRSAAPGWAAALVVAAVVPVFAHHGRPRDKPIISAAIVTERFRRINADVVCRAYFVAGLAHPDRSDQQLEFLKAMRRDRSQTGSEVVIALPHGRTFAEAMNAKAKIASGLDVSMSQVYLTRDKLSERAHQLYVADVDPLSIKAGRTPLLDCKVRDIWKPAPLGVDERGRKVLLSLVFYSMLVGAQPRKGKTFTARALALYAALDPYVRLSVFDGKGSPDWRKFALVAHTYGFGLLPDRVQGDPIQNLLVTLRAMKKDVLQRNVRLSELPTSICPEGKLTRDIARDPRYGMPVWMLILDEFQEFLNTGDEDIDREIADLLVFLVKVGPSVGIVLLSSTQRPSGIGSTGKVAKLFTDFRDNHLTRFALKTGSWQVSDLVLGSGAYSEGFDSSSLPVGDGTEGTYDYRGIGILYDSPAGNCTVRTYLADGQDAEKILAAARAHRERASTLDGMAMGEDVAVQARDPLADALDAFHGDETFLSWETLAARLADQQPERYAEITKDSLSKLLVGLKLGIESKAGAEKGRPTERPRGAYLASLRRAMETRNSDGRR